MKRKIYLLALFLCFFLQSIFSQIEVKSFRLLENDLTANIHATMVKDKNGEVAALIKVVTTERGFTFEAGMSGIVKVKQEAGEIWVYVPSPLSRITIRHPQYGVLRDYYFDIPIEKARTYEMVLFTPKEEPVQSRVVNRQLLVFEVTPPFATVELDGELLKVSEEGRAERDALFGKRSYRVFAPDYHTVEGEVELNDPVNTHVVKVELMPQFGWLQIPETDSLAKAKIYINQKNMGTVPFRSEAMQSGIYHLKIKKPHYKVYREKVEVKDNQTIEFRPQLQRRFTATMLMPQVVFPQNLKYDTPALGLAIGQMDKWGWYLKGVYRSFPNTVGSFFTEDANRYWTTGNEKVGYYAVTAGAIFPIKGLLSGYVGAGHSSRVVAWEMADGNYYTNEAYSHQGFSDGWVADVGLMCRFGRIAFNAGAMVSVPQTKYVLNAGIGFCF